MVLKMDTTIPFHDGLFKYAEKINENNGPMIIVFGMNVQIAIVAARAKCLKKKKTLSYEFTSKSRTFHSIFVQR